MNLRRLRWITIVGPVLFLGALDFVRHEIAPGTLHTGGGFVAIALLVTAATVLFSHLIFGAIERMQRQIDRQTAELAALYAESEQRRAHLDHLINCSGDAIITTDVDGRIRTWSNGAEAIYGFMRAEAVGQVTPMVPSDRVEEARDVIERVLHGETVANFETERRHKSGRRLAVMVTVSPIVDAGGGVVGLMGVSKDLTDKRRLELQERRLALLEERERIAMDLHDGAIQSLYAVGLRLEAAARLAGPLGELGRTSAGAGRQAVPVQPLLEHAVEELNHVIQDIRDYVRGLGPHELAAQGLAEALATLVDDLRDTALVSAHLTVTDGAALMAARLDSRQTGQLLQMAREALSNVARHAAARTADVILTTGVPIDAEAQSEGGWLRLLICDDGRGFDPAMAPTDGRGLRNLTERALGLGGRATVASTPGAGTTVCIEVPATPQSGPGATAEETVALPRLEEIPVP
ncbi:MAG: PAS domain-containing sensor histidine kinase [Chloroflexi bacterium]|nr:PAS domain-containing sensor histidine kinase [Chloroflexota bacterium]